MTTIDEVLGIRRGDDGGAVLAFPRELHGAFGGAFGGLLAAGIVCVARGLAPGREPAGIDCRFVRGLRAGDATATCELVNAGRSLTLIRVELHDEQGKLATSATVSLVDPAALHPLDVSGPAPPEPAEWRSWTMPADVDIPIIRTLEPKMAPLGDGAIATLVRIPWDDEDGTYSAEAACVAADFCVGPPVGLACEGTWLPHPNPDCVVRFAPHRDVGADVVGVGRVTRMVGGLAVVDVEVSSGGVAFASGVCTSMVLGARE